MSDVPGMPPIRPDLRAVLIKIAGARLGGNVFKAVHAAGQTVWIEARKRRGIYDTLKNPRRMMGSEVDELIELGYVRHKQDGTALLIEQTEKRP